MSTRHRTARTLSTMALAATLAAALAGCGGSAGGGSKTVTVVYQQQGDSRVQGNFLEGVKAQYEKAHPGTTVDLQPIIASEDDYYTKLQLQMRSPRTSPDVVYEDTFLINSDIDAGYLQPLDEKLKAWKDWSQFSTTARGAATALDGKTYGVPDGTDTRALWYNKNVFAKAGLPADWQPKTWDDVLAAARAIKSSQPDVVPMNVYAGTGAGEAASMQGFEMLLYGTKDTLYDEKAKKWVIGSQGFKDALTFQHTLFSEGLGPTSKQALDPNWYAPVQQQLPQEDGIGIALDGSWISNNWLKTGPTPWPRWDQVMGVAAMPTQDGGGKGKVSMSGGWTYAIPTKSDNTDGAWDFIKLVTNRENALEYDTAAVQIPVREDVASDPAFTNANPTNEFFASLVPITQYRPAYSVYPRISQEIQAATEALVTGSAAPDQAAASYDEKVKEIAGKDVMKASDS